MSRRYRVGCPGMFVLGMDYGVDDEDEAIASCASGPPGCEVIDTTTGESIGPTCWEEIYEAQRRVALRNNYRPFVLDMAACVETNS
jgi:hypothetical protein